jgi:glycosyltransferase involved in cell wall biosynthesis
VGGEKVLHVVEAFGGGLLRIVVELADAGAAAGHDVVIAYGQRPETPAAPHELLDPRVRVVAMPWTSRAPVALAAGARALRRLVADEAPDVVHLHSSFSGVLGALATGHGVPTVFSPHAFASAVPEGGAARRRAYRALESWVCRSATLVGAQSEVEAGQARRRGAREVVAVPNGIRELNPAALAARAAVLGPPVAPARPRVVATGRTVPQRGPAGAARILGAVRDVAEVAWVGGGGGSRGVAGAAALRAAGIEPTGWVPRERVMTELETATAYLHWTLWDGLSVSVLEALALDVPVVASAIAPNVEVLGDAGTCATEDEAVALLRRLATDPAERERLLAAQRARRERFSAAGMVAGWHALYARLAPAPAPLPVSPPVLA